MFQNHKMNHESRQDYENLALHGSIAERFVYISHPLIAHIMT